MSELITVIKYTCAFPAVTQHVKMSAVENVWKNNFALTSEAGCL